MNEHISAVFHNALANFSRVYVPSCRLQPDDTPDLEVIQDAIDTALALEEICESEDALNEFLPEIRSLIERLKVVGF